MLTSITGVYRNGKIILTEEPRDLPDDTQVIVTFLTPSLIDLAARGIDEAQAADVRTQLQSFVEDWDRPEMDIYNDYDAAKAALETR